MSQVYFATEIRRQYKAVRKAGLILRAATPHQRPRAVRYAGRVTSRLLGLEQGRADRKLHGDEDALAGRVEALRGRVPHFDPASYSDGWRYAFYA